MQFVKHHSALENAKLRAREIRIEKAATDENISHSAALEAVAHELGYRDWNTACALISNHPDISLNIGDKVHGHYLKQPFTARVVSVAEIGGGSHFRVSLDLDEAVDVVTFDSFSAFRKRVSGQIDRRGVSPSKTGDGEAQLTIDGHVHS